MVLTANWCSRKTFCPAAKASVIKAAQTDFAEAPEEDEAIEVKDDPEFLANVLDWAPFVKDYLTACAKKAEGILSEGGSIRGRKLIRKKGNRRFVDYEDPKAFAKQIAKQFGLKEKRPP